MAIALKARNNFRQSYYWLRAVLLTGDRFECPICEGRFTALLSKGVPLRRNAMCPRCFSLERHRLLWLWLTGQCGESDMISGTLRFLHLAPEPSIASNLRARSNLEYCSGDREAGRADEMFDIQKIPYPDNHFDRILCCHVLEHIEDDISAMNELYRVLAPGGALIAQVPLGEGTTQEDGTVTDPRERLTKYGQEDHVRLYGLDFAERLASVGFKVRIARPYDNISIAQRLRFRLAPDGESGEPVFIARK